jgi:hypothetical protein
MARLLDESLIAWARPRVAEYPTGEARALGDELIVHADDHRGHLGQFRSHLRVGKNGHGPTARNRLVVKEGPAVLPASAPRRIRYEDADLRLEPAAAIKIC